MKARSAFLSAWVEPIFERGNRAVVFKWPAVPYPLERWHSVITCSATGSQRKHRIGSDNNRQDIEFRPVVFRDCEALHGGQLIVGVKRRGVTAGAALPIENRLFTFLRLHRPFWRLAVVGANRSTSLVERGISHEVADIPMRTRPVRSRYRLSRIPIRSVPAQATECSCHAALTRLAE